MRAVSPGGAEVQDMATDHGRLYVVMAEKFLDRANIGPQCVPSPVLGLKGLAAWCHVQVSDAARSRP